MPIALDLATSDLPVIGLLIFLEGILSIDNALVLALIVRNLPPEQHKRALSYGIIGAVVFRCIAIVLAAYLMQMRWIKFVGGGYLLYLAYDYFSSGNSKEEKEARYIKKRGFWMTVLIVELTDIAFAVDSILTAVALTKKVWVVLTGGVIGLIMMRYAATVFIGLLKRFPRFESTAYFLVAIIGIKLFLDGFHLPGVDFHSPGSPAFWFFWGAMIASLVYGFTQNKPSHPGK